MSYKRKLKPAEFLKDIKDEEVKELLESQFHGHPQFPVILEELKKLHSNKNKDYATKNTPLGNFIRVGKLISKLLKPGINRPLAACLCLVSKQIDGIYEIIGEQKLDTLESLHDKFRDVAVYTVIAMCILKEIEDKNPAYLEE